MWRGLKLSEGGKLGIKINPFTNVSFYPHMIGEKLFQGISVYISPTTTFDGIPADLKRAASKNRMFGTISRLCF